MPYPVWSSTTSTPTASFTLSTNISGSMRPFPMVNLRTSLAHLQSREICHLQIMFDFFHQRRSASGPSTLCVIFLLVSRVLSSILEFRTYHLENGSRRLNIRLKYTRVYIFPISKALSQGMTKTIKYNLYVLIPLVHPLSMCSLPTGI